MSGLPVISGLRSHWRQLHPLDESIFRRTLHPFDLDYPPPDFRGSVDTAPVIIHGDRRDFPRALTPYYTASGLDYWLAEGMVAIGNAAGEMMVNVPEWLANHRSSD